MHKSINEKAVQRAIEKRSCQIVEEYIKYWTPNKTVEDYPLEQLDSIYYFTIYLHTKGLYDIFNYNTKLFSILFLA